MKRETSPKSPRSPVGSRSLPSTWFSFYPRVHIPNGISIGSAVLAQLMAVTNIQTDRDHETSVTEGRIFALGEYDVA